jgi:hypothetical protein
MRIFLAAIVLVIVVLIVFPMTQSMAQVLPCTVSDGSTLDGLGGILGASNWQESLPPVRLQQGETITFTFTGGTTFRHRWFAYPVNIATPLSDSGFLATPQSVSFTAPTTGDYDYRFTLTSVTTVAISCVLPASATSAGSSLGVPPDDRLNWRYGDLMDVVYLRRDSQDNPALHVYTVNANSVGVIVCTVTHEDATPFVDNPPAQNTFIRACDAHSSIYYLTSDELQMNIGPDAEGKVYVLVFDSTTLQPVHRYAFNAFEAGN